MQNKDSLSPEEQGKLELLQLSLEAYVPLYVFDIQAAGYIAWMDDLLESQEEWVDTLTSKGDILLYKSPKKGDTAKVFNTLARAIAYMSFVTGGIRVFGLKFESHFTNTERMPDDVAEKEIRITRNVEAFTRIIRKVETGD